MGETCGPCITAISRVLAGIATAVAGGSMIYLGLLDAACISGTANIRTRFRAAL
jgi:hypothetical protein